MVSDIQSNCSIAVSSRPVARRLNNANSLKKSNNGRLEIIKASLAKRVVGGQLRGTREVARVKKPTERPKNAGEGQENALTTGRSAVTNRSCIDCIVGRLSS